MNNHQLDVYYFKWNDIGDIALGRPNLGPTTLVAVYRLMQYTMKDVLNINYGPEKSQELFYEAGLLAGKEFCKNMLNTHLPLNEFIAQLHDILLKLTIGVLKIEKFDPEHLNFTLTISEDLDCSGLPITGNTVCDYDEGFIAGILETYSGKKFYVKEIDCWSTGDRTCRFIANPI